jgi:L-histidine N-alpha-methyltransferase
LISEVSIASDPRSAIAHDVRRGLASFPKRLPAYLFYDEAGSRLYERITELPEYYLTRAERAIFEAHARTIVMRVTGGPIRATRPLGVVELGAGSASKTEVLLRAVLERQDRCRYVPIDVSRAAVEGAERRLREELPRVDVRHLIMTHEEALGALPGMEGPNLVLFIGSSVGNLEDPEAASLLRRLRGALGAETSLLLGTDLRKSPDVLLPAYDDAAGVTAAFNKNMLVRINRELGGRFDLDLFRHVARWNDAASRVEMHLESTVAQTVAIDRLGLRVRFEARETIHTESSVKYDLPRVEQLLRWGGFALETTFYDDARRFGVHLARAM